MVLREVSTSDRDDSHYRIEIHNRQTKMVAKMSSLSTSKSENLRLLCPCHVFHPMPLICRVRHVDTQIEDTE